MGEQRGHLRTVWRNEKHVKRTKARRRIELTRAPLCLADSSAESFMSGNGLISLPGWDWR